MRVFKLINDSVVAITMTTEMHQAAVSGGEEYLSEQDPQVVAYLAVQPTEKSLTWIRIKAERDRRKAGGFKVGTLWYHSDEASRGQYSILLSMAVEKSIPVGTALSPAWKDMAGNFAPMTVALLRQIRDAGLALEQQLFTIAETHRMAMEASADPASYDFSTGWPAAYTA